ncbi:MAG: TauD/TfdA family dioxygenase [Novosphingobium sp.]|nr:TauD/TfdA family dioxygenase [Novosphingobium sp.]
MTGIEQAKFGDFAAPGNLVGVDIDELRPGAVAALPKAGAPPLFIQHDGSMTDAGHFMEWSRERRSLLDELVLRHGGIVLRGFPIDDAEQFNRFANLFPIYAHGYAGGMAPRRHVTGDVLESTYLTQDFKLSLHSEMAYMKNFPPRIAFFCEQASCIGGETIIGSLAELTRRIPPALRERIERHKVRVVRNYAPCGSSRDLKAIEDTNQIGWDEAFETEDPTEAERLCGQLGLEFEWNEDGSLTLFDLVEPFTIHPKTQERVYRSSLHTDITSERQGMAATRERLIAQQKHPSGSFLDTGEKLTREEAECIHRIQDEIEISWQWRDGDLMILDNLQVAHGRNPYSGPRLVHVALLE